jgi:hypothetical protein
VALSNTWSTCARMLHRFRSLAVLFGSAALIVIPARASAQSFVNVTQCDSVSIDGQSYGRVTFSIVNQKLPSTVIYHFSMDPVSHQVPEDTCHVLALTFPDGWSGGQESDGKMLFFSEGDPIDVGDKVGEFQLALSRSVCCYRFLFVGAIDVPFAFETVCLECDLATPVRESTWGRLKQHYR